MSQPPENVSRFTHFRAWLSRQARGRRKDTIAIFVLAIAGIVMMLGIFTQQKASLPAWLPVVGDPLCAVAGWLKLPFWPCLVYMAIGKFGRYLVFTAALIGFFPGQYSR